MSDTTTAHTPTAPAPATPPQGEADLSAQIDALFADFPGGGEATAAAPVAAAPAPAVEHKAPEPPASSSVLPATKAEPPKPTTPAPVAAAPAPAPIVVEEVAPRGDVLLRAIGVASIPLMSRPPVVRKAVGLIAVNSLVLGALLWTWVLFLRPVPEQVAAKSFDFGKGSVPAVPAKEVAAEHGADATKDDGHGARAKKDDGHGGTAKKADAKKPPAKKAESHGGGH